MKMLLGTLVLLLSINSYSSGLPIAGFADVGFNYTTVDDGTTKVDTNSFQQGGLDFYYTKNMGQGVNALAEVVFEMGADNAPVLDIERLWLQKTISPWFKIKFGRVHTALGYWNDTYHHGTWLHNSIARPLMYNFEDANGILPMHTMGLEFRGSGHLGSGTFGYIANIGNGRGIQADPPQIVNDANRGKAFNFLAYYEWRNGLRVGAVAYTDDLPRGRYTDTNNVTQDAVPGKELITGGHLVYKTSKIEFLTEYLNLKHTYKDNLNTVTNTTAMYSQLSYTMNKCTPYVRYDLVKSDKTNKDFYLNHTAGRKDSSVVAGIRYDMTYTSALKLEYGANKLENGTGIGSTKKTNTVNLNWSYAW